MGKIEFSNCQDVRNQKKIQELDCPRCHEPGGIEAFVKDGILAEDGVCDNCGYILPDSLLAKALARRGKKILVIDSDESNYGLHRQLGMKLPRDFTDYFGGKQNVLNDMMLSKFTHQFLRKPGL